MLKSRLINTINTTTKLHRFLNTRPAMSNKVSYDAIVVGSGQGGNPLAMELQKQGRKTAVIEAAHVGGKLFCYHPCKSIDDDRLLC